MPPILPRTVADVRIGVIAIPYGHDESMGLLDAYGLIAKDVA